jgi:hypothetical protein
MFVDTRSHVVLTLVNMWGGRTGVAVMNNKQIVVHATV